MTETMLKTLQDVLDSIIAERGGPDAFTPVQMMAARGLTRCLGALKDGDTSKASAIETLQAMLPPKVTVPSGPPVDYGRLSDREVFAAEKLYRIAAGLEPIREHRRKSNTHWDAVRVAALADQVHARGVHAELTGDERTEFKQCLALILCRAGVTVRSLWPEHCEAPVTLPGWASDLAPLYGGQDSPKAAGRSLRPADDKNASATPYSTSALPSTEGRPSSSGLGMAVRL